MANTSTTKRKRLQSGAAQLAILIALTGTTGCRPSEDIGPVADATSAAKIRQSLSSGAGEASSAEAAAPAGTGWATIKGRFVFDGTPPTMAPYNANKDQATCTIDGKAPLQETLLVDSETKGIANVAIYVRKVSRVHESAQPTNDKVLFDQKACVFLTHVLPMTIGQTLELKNSDPVGHNTNISGKNSFNQTIPANESVDYTPQKEEAMPVSAVCSIHPWMSSYVVMRSNGYCAVTGPDGSFEIANVPAGEELEFQVWHESGQGPSNALVLNTPEGKELKWSKKGRFKIKLAEDEVKEIQLTVPA
ncbi:MAG: hypothetical protein GXP28_02675, partial [Planctomycetes bacterium]|nr:hypothetical protein [Planctomycetota bacterium]